MITIPLANIPNQSFSSRLDNSLYEIVIKSTNGVMSCDIRRDNVVIQSGARMVAGTPLIPYQYQESGNFVLLTNNEEYPDYTQFGITQQLIYASQAELEAIRDNAGA